MPPAHSHEPFQALLAGFGLHLFLALVSAKGPSQRNFPRDVLSLCGVFVAERPRLNAARTPKEAKAQKGPISAISVIFFFFFLVARLFRLWHRSGPRSTSPKKAGQLQAILFVSGLGSARSDIELWVPSASAEKGPLSLYFAYGFWQVNGGIFYEIGENKNVLNNQSAKSENEVKTECNDRKTAAFAALRGNARLTYLSAPYQGRAPKPTAGTPTGPHADPIPKTKAGLKPSPLPFCGFLAFVSGVCFAQARGAASLPEGGKRQGRPAPKDQPHHTTANLKQHPAASCRGIGGSSVLNFFLRVAFHGPYRFIWRDPKGYEWVGSILLPFCPQTAFKFPTRLAGRSPI
ncbi:hypothetical protein LSM04_002696 [Trypanosoma melophagium]|uniref:uncharacterized protein n=1 Tax=Trypanosoma melophagium TaxID=715481 RepID=UPI00351A146C|nr:hypothetical protein LSM04_002696 [Trypanosoma melophagium]